MMKTFLRWSLFFSVTSLLLLSGMAESARLKDIADIRGVRPNQLVGYGLVVGLNGTGDNQQAYFTLASVQLMLRRLGVPADQANFFDLRNLRLRNTAAVMVTAELPAFGRVGSRIDVTVSSLGNASSLQGGTLLMTPLRGADLQVYAVGQGSLSVGGFIAQGRTGSSISKNITTVGRVPEGAIIEREVPSTFVHKALLAVNLRRPDFTTSMRLSDAINKSMGDGVASAQDPSTIMVKIPKDYKEKSIEFVAKMEVVDVETDVPARVIINERTGTVVIGQDVKLKPVAISHGGLTLEISEQFLVSQPVNGLFGGGGTTAVVPNTDIKATEKQDQLKIVDSAATLSDVVKALNALGVGPRDLIAIFQALENSGALPAQLIIQ